MLFVAAVILFISAIIALPIFIAFRSPTNVQAHSCGDKTISAKGLIFHECKGSEWHFVITQTEDDCSLAPDHIDVTWQGGITEVVNKTDCDGKTAHYTTTLHLDIPVISATAEIDCHWSGQFNLSHGPCSFPSPSPSHQCCHSPSPTPSPSHVCSPSPSPTPSSCVSPTPSPSGSPEASPSPSASPSESPSVSPSGSPEESPSSSPEESPSPSGEVSPSPSSEASASPQESTSPAPEASSSPSSSSGVGGTSESTGIGGGGTTTQGQVLGVSTLASTGPLDSLVAQVLQFLGSALSILGITVHGKKKR
jgi:hypothetical protein